jgi:PAS domain S-box-containing protein
MRSLPEICNSPFVPIRNTLKSATIRKITDANHFGDFARALFSLGQPDAWRAMMDTTVVAAFLEYSPNPTWLADSDGRCVYVNRALRKISAICANEFSDLSWLEFVADEDRNLSSTLWQEARVNHQPYRARFFLGGKNSARRSAVDVVGAGHVAPDGAEVWLFTAVPSPSSSTALPPIETNLQTTLNALPIQAWYARASGVIAFVNQTTAKYLGLPSDHPLGFAGEFEASWDAHVAFLHPDDRAHSSRNWKEVIESGKTSDDQFRILGADGKYRWFLTQADPLRDSDGQIQYWVGVNINIDDGRRASEALDAVRERMGRATQSAAIAEISTSLSHRIVQPIAAVVANARAALNWLSSKNLNIPQANAALEGVVQDGMFVGNIVHEMRQYFDHRQPAPQPIDLNALLDQVITLQDPDLRDKRIVVNRELDPGLPFAFADKAQIQQVLFNLMVDACEAISRSGREKELTIRTNFFGERVCLEVQDNGGCVTDLEEIMETIVADESRGTVVALAISRSIIDAQEGKLEVIRLEGGATCIRIELPRFISREVAVSPPVQLPHPLYGGQNDTKSLTLVDRI